MKIARATSTPHACIFALAVLLAACRDTGGTSENPVARSGAPQYATDEMSLQAGMALFNAHCGSCHNFEQQEIGPNLAGITSEVGKEWLISFIRNPAGKIDGGDQRAVASFEKYGMYMPGFDHLSESEMENLLGFIHGFSRGESRNRSNRKGGLLDPIPEKIQASGITLVIEDAFRIPRSSDNPPHTRVNKLATVHIGGRQQMFIADLRGTLYRAEQDTVSEYLNIREFFPDFIDQPGFGTGFGSFAFHPAFERNGLLFTTHTEPAGSAKADFALPDSVPAALQWVLTAWKTQAPNAKKLEANPWELLRIDMHSHVHGVQEIAFNPFVREGHPDYGMLYVGVGDGGMGASDTYPLVSSKAGVWGAVLRIDPGGNTSQNGQYGIPGDNPYSNEANALGEIWCRGFRNPHRFSWDPSDPNRMFISNIGQHSVEEVNIGMAGAHYGWPQREGAFLFDPNANTELVYPLPPQDHGYSYPTAQYDHDEGNAICGGYVFDSESVPILQGKYIFGDIPRGTLFYFDTADIEPGTPAPVYKLSLEYNGELTSLEERVPGRRVDLRFGLGPDRSLMILTKADGRVYRVIGARAGEAVN